MCKFPRGGNSFGVLHHQFGKFQLPVRCEFVKHSILQTTIATTATRQKQVIRFGGIPVYDHSVWVFLISGIIKRCEQVSVTFIIYMHRSWICMFIRAYRPHTSNVIITALIIFPCICFHEMVFYSVSVQIQLGKECPTTAFVGRFPFRSRQTQHIFFRYQSVYVIQPVISIGPHTRYSGNIYPIVFHSHPFRNGPIVALALYHFIP